MRPGMKLVIKSVRGKHGTIRRGYWEKQGPKLGMTGKEDGAYEEFGRSLQMRNANDPLKRVSFTKSLHRSTQNLGVPNKEKPGETHPQYRKDVINELDRNWTTKQVRENRINAKDPMRSIPPKEQEEILDRDVSSARGKRVRARERAWAQNPNTPTPVLSKLAETQYDAVKRNPAAFLATLENPRALLTPEIINTLVRTGHPDAKNVIGLAEPDDLVHSIHNSRYQFGHGEYFDAHWTKEGLNMALAHPDAQVRYAAMQHPLTTDSDLRAIVKKKGSIPKVDVSNAQGTLNERRNYRALGKRLAASKKKEELRKITALAKAQAAEDKKLKKLSGNTRLNSALDKAQGRKKP